MSHMQVDAIAMAESWTESPVEAMFVRAVVSNTGDTELIVRVPSNSRFSSLAGLGPARGLIATPDLHVAILVQPKICLPGMRGRLDFAFLTEAKRVNVEIDGHEFHERTKEQARRDHARDRAMSIAGWQVVRFTGSEVYSNAVRCVFEAVNFLWSETGNGRW